jgi:hypothetical protein
MVFKGENTFISNPASSYSRRNRVKAHGKMAVCINKAGQKQPVFFPRKRRQNLPAALLADNKQFFIPDS